MDIASLAQIMGSSGAAAIMGQQAPAQERQQLLANDNSLERLYASQQERAFSAQDQPYKNEALRLDNIGKDTSNQEAQFKLGVDKAIGVDGYVEKHNAEVQDKHVKSAQAGADLLGQIGASLGEVSPGLEGNFAREHAIRQLNKALGMPLDVAQRAVQNPQALIEMGRAMVKNTKAGITQEVKNEFATRLQAQRAADNKIIEEIKTGSAEKRASGHDATQLAAAKLRAGASTGSRAAKDPTTFEAGLINIINQKAGLDPSDPQYEVKLNALDKKQQLFEAFWTTRIDNSKPPAVVPTGQIGRDGKPIYGPNREAPPTKEIKLRDAKAQIGAGQSLKGVDGKYEVGLTGRGVHPKTGKPGTWKITDPNGGIDFKEDK